MTGSLKWLASRIPRQPLLEKKRFKDYVEDFLSEEFYGPVLYNQKIRQTEGYLQQVSCYLNIIFFLWMNLCKNRRKFYDLKIFFLFVVSCNKWVLLWRTIMGWCLTLRRIINILNIVWPKETVLHLTGVASIIFSLIHRKIFFCCSIFFLHGNDEGWRIDQLKHWTIFGILG